RIRRQWVVVHWRDVPKHPVQVPAWRSGRWIQVQVQPQPTPGVASLAWLATALLQAGWSWLALLVLWQHPRDRRAVLLSLVLLGAQSLFVPGTPRPLVLALALHLFLAFPNPLPFLDRPRHLWTIYLPAAAAGFLA